MPLVAILLGFFTAGVTTAILDIFNYEMYLVVNDYFRMPE